MAADPNLSQTNGRQIQSADCNHNNIVQDKAERVYRCKDCGTVVGHFLTFAERTERKAEIENYATKLRGVVSIGNGLYARTRGGK